MTLRTYLDENRPAWREHTDEDNLAWLSEEVAIRRPINSRQLLRWGGAGGRLAKLEDAAVEHASQNIRAVARAAVLTVTRPDTELDLADPSHEALVDALVAGGVLTAEDKAELVAMATSSTTRWLLAGMANTDDLSALYWIAEARQ